MTTTSTPSTSTKTLIDDGAVRPHCSPFGLPIGFKGRLAGWYMSLPDRQHNELTTTIPVEQATSLVEIGFGPGATMRTLHRRNPGLRLAGVDPSDLMLAAATRRNPTTLPYEAPRLAAERTVVSNTCSPDTHDGALGQATTRANPA